MKISIISSSSILEKRLLCFRKCIAENDLPTGDVSENVLQKMTFQHLTLPHIKLNQFPCFLICNEYMPQSKFQIISRERGKAST